MNERKETPVQKPGTHEVMITSSAERAWGSWGVGPRGSLARPRLSVMCSVTSSQLSEPRFLFTGKGGPVSCTCGNWFSAAEMPPGGSVGVQQETDGTYSRIL